jgi:hypothetical protein
MLRSAILLEQRVGSMTEGLELVSGGTQTVLCCSRRDAG